MLLKVLVMVTLAFANQEPKQNRNVSKKQIVDGCMKLLTQANKKKICDCIVVNLDKKANDYEMEILAKQYTKPTDSLEGSALLTYDAEVAEQCVANPQWRTTPRSTDSVSDGQKK